MTLDPGRGLAVLCVFEDRAFEDVALPLIERIFEGQGVIDTEIRTRLTHGCQWRELGRLGRDYETWPDLLIIGADTRGETVAQKRRSMEAGIQQRLPPRLQHARCLLALAQPSAEGWLQADLAALKAGLAEALDEPVSLPADAGPYPRSEQAAKDRLRALLHAAEVPALRGGLEYGPPVMREVETSAETSLEEFAGALRHWIQRWRAQR